MVQERKINLPDIVRSTEPCIGFSSAPGSLAAKKYEEVYAFVVFCVKSYLEYAYPGQVGISAMFAADLIEKYPTWKIADFVNVFKFLRHRQDMEELKVMGNTMTPAKLMELVGVYEAHRSEEFLKFKQEQAGKYKEENRKGNPVTEKILKDLREREKIKDATGDKRFGQQSEATAAEQERERTEFKNGRFQAKEKPRTIAPDETYFEREHKVKSA